MTLNAFSVPRICSDLQGQDLHWVKETYQRLKDIDFADTCADCGPMQIDLLIGSDYIWNFFLMERRYGGRSRVKVVLLLSRRKWTGCCPARLKTFPRRRCRVYSFRRLMS